jgi:hypothetical protein
MRVGPSEPAIRSAASNPRELLSLRAMVVSVAEKAGRRSRQVRSKETSESEPPMNCRKRSVDVRTGVGGHSGISAGGALKTGPRGVRLEGGVTSDQALTRNRRTVVPMPRETAERVIPARPRVPMRGTGAEQPVVGWKAL